jgi:hypothetical protein
VARTLWPVVSGVLCISAPLSLVAAFAMLVLGACEGAGGEAAPTKARDRDGAPTHAQPAAGPPGSTAARIEVRPVDVRAGDVEARRAAAARPSPPPAPAEFPRAPTATARLDVTPDESISRTENPPTENPASESRTAALDSFLVSCPAVPQTPYTDCDCPEGSAAIGGGAYAPGKLVLKESRPLTATTWRIACQALDGTQLACAAGEPGAVWIVCGRVDAAK